MILRHIRDENYLYEFRSHGAYQRALYWIWWLTSDCGRSLGRWVLLTVGIVFIFAFLYRLVDIDYGSYATPLSSLYYSVVTLTTLGYGDVVPASAPAQMLAAFQAVVGYVLLGGLLSLLANKMARRAE